MRTIANIALSVLLLTACGSHHENHSIDTTLALTEDSISSDITFDIRMRNVLGIWVDSAGTIYLNHDLFGTPPPPPPPGENYEYVDDRKVYDIGLLREKVKQFIANPDDNPNLSEKIMIDIPLLGEYHVSKGFVSILTMDGAGEDAVEPVRKEIAAAIIELRDSLSHKAFGLHYGELNDDQTEAINEAIQTPIYDTKKNRFYQITTKPINKHN